MYQLIIHWDNQEPQIVSGQTKPEIYQQLDKMNINPDEALWELKWVPDKVVVNGGIVNSMPGCYKKE